MDSDVIKDGWVHFAPPDLSMFAPCGKRIGRALGQEYAIHPCAHDFARVSCPDCRRKVLAETRRRRKETR